MSEGRIPYTPDAAQPDAWIVDIDGTLALRNDRGIFDWGRVGEDSPNEPVIRIVDALDRCGQVIVLLSGRPDSCQRGTETWLKRHRIPYDELHMRADGDWRPDEQIKYDIFDTKIRDRWCVQGVIDDRSKVVNMWRRDLGLICLAAADGNF